VAPVPPDAGSIVSDPVSTLHPARRNADARSVERPAFVDR